MMIKPGASAVDGVLVKSAETDAFVAELKKCLQQIAPDVAGVVAELHFNFADKAVHLPKGQRQSVGMMALELAAAASCVATILDEVGDLSGARQRAAVETFAGLLKYAREVHAQKRLEKIMGHA